MENEIVFNDDTLFDRLADGELSPAERRKLLLSFDSQPDRWRRCALAFLEAQAWKMDLGRVTQPSISVELDGATLSDRELSSKHSRSRQWRWLQSGWMTVATSLLFVITLGAVLQDRLFTPTTPAHVATHPRAPIAAIVPPPSTAAAKASPGSDAITLWVRDETGKTRPLRVPLVDADKLDRQLGMEFHSGVPAAMRNDLQRNGYEVQSKQRYAPLWLENGRPLVVPVEDTKIVPASRRVY